MDTTQEPNTILSLCSGGAGLDRGLERALQTCRVVTFVEIEAYACSILAKQMEIGWLSEAPIWTDIKTFNGKPYRGKVRFITAGFPCQPFSQAGKRKGEKDPRHLWPHVRRIINQVRPEYVFLENVRGHLSLGFDKVCRQLQKLDYQVSAGLYSAQEIGAPHKRQRLFILAHSNRMSYQRLRTSPEMVGQTKEIERKEDQRERSGDAFNDSFKNLANSNSDRLDKQTIQLQPREPQFQSDMFTGESNQLGNSTSKGLQRWGCDLQYSNQFVPWPASPEDKCGWTEYLQRWPFLKPAVLRGSDELANRVHRLRLLGNGVVPEQAKYAFLDLYRQLKQ